LVEPLQNKIDDLEIELKTIRAKLDYAASIYQKPGYEEEFRIYRLANGSLSDLRYEKDDILNELESLESQISNINANYKEKYLSL
jgi:prefoldin subunit 5